MDELTQRQISILTAIIREYTDSGCAVGSEIIERKYKLGVSPATIRNEMVDLEKKGYLQKTHFSSGRLPSPKGYRFFINNVMEEKQLSTVDEVAYKHSIWDDRNKKSKMLSQASRVLAARTGLLSLVATSDGDLYYSGINHILDDNELADVSISRGLFQRLDEINFWEEILRQTHVSQSDLYFILGPDDFRDPFFDRCSSIFGDFEAAGTRGIIGVVGPKHLKYELVAPQIRFFSGLIEEIIQAEDSNV
ncbi:hypothetical protein COY14_00800 [Candidatus Roizmanbacteria bacterium CG_4_10_14_0_2_um_filter_36_9]|uniref:Heat-inducible transcription repressor HrcA C-terminal domain-containing protein n=2 Tax=Candidatus Roizmaniibacteriota TaxID=1752723 RepID=A0A2M7U5I3_9BACT|nr:MAG: hypothetical protein COY14_00800 [Candidatus Roizmanbacteria bacterium CG_4_10_14_0_2_um_filter_36_9]